MNSQPSPPNLAPVTSAAAPSKPLLEPATPSKSPVATGPSTRLPAFLDPVGDPRELGLWGGSEVVALMDEFARQYRVEPDLALVSILAGAAHSLGGSIRWDLPWGPVHPPFNLLIATPEPDPVWTEVPLRFLRDGLAGELSNLFGPSPADLLNPPINPPRQPPPPRQPGRPGGDTPARSSSGPRPELAMARLIHDSVLRETLNGPMPIESGPLDGRVTLTTPRVGLLASLDRLGEAGRLHLEVSLLGGRELRDPGSRTHPAHGAYWWQLPTGQLGALFRRHGWLAGIPFLLMVARDTGFPGLDTEGRSLTAIGDLNRRLFRERIARYGRPMRLRLSGLDSEPVMRFLHDAQLAETQWPDPWPARWVAELGLRFSLILMRIRGQDNPGDTLVASGLELAKRMARLHHEHLAAHGAPLRNQGAETAELTDRQRLAYLKIVELGRVRRADLRKSFHQMPARERDEVVACLLARGLIRQEGEFLMQRAA
jgi:hypothetical protein